MEENEITLEERPKDGAEEIPNDGNGGTPKASDDGDGKKGDEEWFVPGKYRTQKDAVVNQDKQLAKMFEVQSKLTKVIEELAQNKPAPKLGSPAENAGESDQERLDRWNELFQTNPTEALVMWERARKDEEAKEKLRLKEELKGELKGELIWQTFIDNNPDINNREKVGEILQVLTEWPKLATRKDAFMIAKEIVLSEGETLDDKVEAYFRKDKKDKPKDKEPGPIVPSGGTSKGGGPKLNDAWAVVDKALSG